MSAEIHNIRDYQPKKPNAMTIAVLQEAEAGGGEIVNSMTDLIDLAPSEMPAVWPEFSTDKDSA